MNKCLVFSTISSKNDSFGMSPIGTCLHWEHTPVCQWFLGTIAFSIAPGSKTPGVTKVIDLIIAKAETDTAAGPQTANLRKCCDRQTNSRKRLTTGDCSMTV